VTWGLGGAVGYLASGRLYDLLPGAGLFLVAAAAEVAPALLALFLPVASPSPEPGGAVLGSERS
jgi:hypothetical protein